MTNQNRVLNSFVIINNSKPGNEKSVDVLCFYFYTECCQIFEQETNVTTQSDKVGSNLITQFYLMLWFRRYWSKNPQKRNHLKAHIQEPFSWSIVDSRDEYSLHRLQIEEFKQMLVDGHLCAAYSHISTIFFLSASFSEKHSSLSAGRDPGVFIMSNIFPFRRCLTAGKQRLEHLLSHSYQLVCVISWQYVVL